MDEPVASNTEPQDYLLARITEALATDGRTHALGVALELSEEGRTLVVTGTVACAERSEAVERVIRDVLPDRLQLENRLIVQEASDPGPAEPVT